jgi:arylsulfatase A-like enzyme
VRSWAALLGAVVLAWWATVTWIVPQVIRAAHAGTIPGLGNLMPGRDSRPVDGYLESWVPIGRSSAVVVATVALILVLVLLFRHLVRRRRAAPAPLPATATGLLLVAGWIGLLTGLAEAWYFGLRVFYQELESPGVSGISQHTVWMSPLANLVALLIVGGLLVAGWAAARGRVQPRVIIAGVTWVGLFSLTMTTGRFHWVASALVTLGLATQLGRTLSPGGGEVVAWARRSTPWLLALVIGMGLLVPIAESRRERRQLAAAGTPAPDAPNVLFVVLDTERAASTSLHGAARPTTPFLEDLAREGVQFERAIAPTSWTLPSHAAMFTGRRAHELGVGWNAPLGDHHPTLAEALARSGYATAGFVSNTKYLSDLMGLDRGFGVWKDQPLMIGTVIVHSWLTRTVVEYAWRKLGSYQFLRRKTADLVNAEFLRWADRRPDRPFFAFLNYFDPHIPYLPPEPWNLRFSETPPMYAFPHDGRTERFTAAELAELATAYDSCIAYLDDRLRDLFDGLRQRGLLDNTLVVITSDHGEDLGEGSEVGHGHDLSMAVVHVPLVILHPGRIPAGRRVSAPVELRHLAATVAGLAGVPADHRLSGSSLEDLWLGGDDSFPARPAFAHFAQMAAIVSDTFQLVRIAGRPERLYNHRADPLGLRDLSGDPVHAGLMTGLRNQLEAWLAERH